MHVPVFFAIVYASFSILFQTALSSDGEEKKRILLNDPTLMDQRLAHLEQFKQEQTAENTRLKSLVQNLESKIAILNGSEAHLQQFTLEQTAENARLKGLVQDLESKITTIQQGNGATFTRWGKESCPFNTSLVYSGYSGGGWWTNKGSATNYLCMPQSPIHSTKTGGYANHIWGVEYQDNVWKDHSLNEDAPCAVCQSTGSTSVLMIPGRDECFSGWNKQYGGFIATGASSHDSAKEYVCVDSDADFVSGGHRDTDGALFYSVSYACGALPCPPYINGNIANCVVCTK